MRLSLSLLGALVALSSVLTFQQNSLTIPVVGPAASVRCEYFAELSSDIPFRGATVWGRVADRPGTVIINTAPVNEPTKRLKQAFIYCPGFMIASLRDIYYGDGLTRTAPINPQPLRQVRVTGRVAFPSNALRPSVRQIQVCHLAYWIVETYGTWDGAIPQYSIASVPLNSDDSFTVDLPDLSQDPLAGRFRTPGWFQFSAVVGDTRFNLQPPVEMQPSAGVAPGFPLSFPPWVRYFALPAAAPDRMEVAFTAVPPQLMR